MKHQLGVFEESLGTAFLGLAEKVLECAKKKLNSLTLRFLSDNLVH